MAGLNGILRVAGVALTATTTKTLMQLVAGTNQRLKIREIGISFRGDVNTEQPVLVDALYQTTAGTSSALTPAKENDGDAETLQATALQTVTVEPTAGNIVRSWEVHPQSGIVIPFPVDDCILVGGGKRFGIRATAPEAQTVSAYIRYEE